MDFVVGNETLSPAQAEILGKRGITPEMSWDAGVMGIQDEGHLPPGMPDYWTVENGYLPGLLFRWTSPLGVVEHQLRPDVPVGEGKDARKYVFRPDAPSILTTARAWVDDGDGVLITEGTCQTIAAAASAPAGWSVYGIAGCQSWTKVGVPTADLEVVDGRTVLIALDADAATNWSVYDAGVRLREACLAAGATTVRFLRVPGGGKSGLDDVLAGQAPERREAYLARLITMATERPKSEKPEAPAAVKPKQRGSDDGGDVPFMADGQLQVKDMAEHILTEHPAALTAEGLVAVYREGVFRIQASALAVVTTGILGNVWRPGHHAAVEGFTEAELARRGQFLPERMDSPLMNTLSGMVDLRTGELTSWSPEYGSVVQFPVHFDPAATAPRYEDWASDQVGDQLAALEEAVCGLLDPTVTPSKAVFLFGPSRTGKGTYLRILETMSGKANTSGVSLHQLSGNKFMAAPLYGKALNVSGDLSAAHVEDISMFKMMTGEDIIEADRKYGKPFTFTNRALFAFSANELPTIGESSSAYTNRIKPFHFSKTFEGREDPRLEMAILREMPGILNRWIAAWQSRQDRGMDMAMDAGVVQAFKDASDRVSLFLTQCTVVGEAESHTTTTQLYAAFRDWTADEGRMGMGKHKFGVRLETAHNVAQVRHPTTRVRGWNVRLLPKMSWSESSGRAVRADLNPTVSSTQNVNIVTSKSDPPPDTKDGSETARTARDFQESYVSPALPPGVVVFDIESADKIIWPWRSDFIRITGLQVEDSSKIIVESSEANHILNVSRGVVGHNILGFDLVAFAVRHDLDIETMADEGRIIDTMLTEVLSNPPVAGTKIGQVMKEYSLDKLGMSKFGVGKTDSLPALADKHGGYDKIPVDDPEYQAYCLGDVALTTRILQSQAGARTPYVVREHKVMAIAARMRISGFRVDLELLADRVAAGKATRERLRDRLATEYGLPLLDPKGRPYKAPQSSAKGKEAIAQALTDVGVTVARTPKSGSPALGKEALDAVLEDFPGDESVRALVEVVQELNGVRTVYDTVDRCRVGDRVHPNITAYQASGRWSFSEPGLTVMGKRNGRHVEREIFLPEDGHVLITADLSQIDNRMVAAHCQDEAYMALFGPGMDVHAVNAQVVFGDASRRDDAKILGHGWNYSMGIAKLAKLVGSEDVAREFDAAMRDNYPDLVEWKEYVAGKADAGHLLDNGWGRKLRTTPNRGWTQAPALIGQSAAMDALKHGLLRLPRWVRPMLRAVIHDEVILSVPLDRVDEAEAVVLEALTFDWKPNGSTGRTIHVEAGLGKRGVSWGDCYSK